MGPDKDDPAVKTEIEKYVSVRTPNPSQVGIAFPGTFILDKEGRVTSRFFEDFYIERNTVSSIMMRLGNRVAPVAGTKVSTAHLEITTYPSDSAVAPGNRFSIALDIQPRNGIHVYAPGVKNYRVIGLNIRAQPFVRTIPVKYPASEIYFFQATERTGSRFSETVHADSRSRSGRNAASAGCIT